MSHVELGIPFRATSEDSVRQARGISVHATEAQARRKARQVPVLGRRLAELRVANNAGLIVERTAGGAGHHTIWGDAAAISSAVIRVIEV